MTDNSYSGQARQTDGSSEYNELDFLVRQILGRSATASLVLVKAVNGDRLDVQPMVAQIDGQGNATPHGIIHGVPFMRYQGGVNAVIIDPVAGDIGIAVFASHDISSAKANKAPSNPGSRRRFDWADAMYIGGLLNGAPTRFIQFTDSGITITAVGMVTINGDVHVSGTLTADTDVLAAGKSLTTHTHTGVTVGTGVTGPPV